MRVFTVGLVGLVLVVSMGSGAALAQPLGTFSWQLSPFCNVVTVNVTQTGALYTLDGFDTQCGGAAPRAPLVGVITINPNGTLGMGLTVVTAPSGAPVHVAATITLSSLSGTWQDSAGNRGAFVFNGNGAGAPRPAAAGTGGGAVTSVTAGAGLTGGGTTGSVTLAVDSSAVQSRVSQACPSGQAMRSVNTDGTVSCQVTGDITSVAPGAGLTGGAAAGVATLAIQTAGVTTAMLADDAVTTAKIGTNAVRATHIGANAIADTSQIAAGAITVADFGTLVTSNGVSAITIPARGCVTLQAAMPSPVAKGSLMMAIPNAANPAMPGIASAPMIAMDDGPFVYQLCNSTNANVTTAHSFFTRVVIP